MDLPKNVTLVGQADEGCRIYVEDYVMTYLKQLNALAVDKEIAAALYGVRREEEEVSYLFLYGAGRVKTLQKNVRHLSQAQNQEIEKLRKRYFEEYRFWGYCVLNGEMLEGIHVCEQGICRYVEGYAQFYEKNESMLAYMLATRESGAEPEKVNREKYDAERQKREERKNLANRQANGLMNRQMNRQMNRPWSDISVFACLKTAAILGFAILGICGVGSLKKESEGAALRVMGDKILEQLSEDKILEGISGGESVSVQEKALQGKEIVQPKEAVQESVVQGSMAQEGVAQEGVAQEGVAQEGMAQEGMAQETRQEEVPQGEETEEVPREEVVLTENTEPVSAPVERASYTIVQGDNLIGISVRIYGDDSMVEAICALNQIENPDDVKVGQKILLP